MKDWMIIIIVNGQLASLAPTVKTKWPNVDITIRVQCQWWEYRPCERATSPYSGACVLFFNFLSSLFYSAFYSNIVYNVCHLCLAAIFLCVYHSPTVQRRLITLAKLSSAVLHTSDMPASVRWRRSAHTQTHTTIDSSKR